MRSSDSSAPSTPLRRAAALVVAMAAVTTALLPLTGAHAAGESEQTGGTPWGFAFVGAGIGLALMVAVLLAARRQGRRTDGRGRDDAGSAPDHPLG